MKNLKLKIIPAFTNYEDENTMTTWNRKKTYSLTKSFKRNLIFAPNSSLLIQLYLCKDDLTFGNLNLDYLN